MQAFNSNLTVLVVCALAAAIVIYASVYLSIDPSILSAAMPPG
jgi:hypothetical protein